MKARAAAAAGMATAMIAAAAAVGSGGVSHATAPTIGSVQKKASAAYIQAVANKKAIATLRSRVNTDGRALEARVKVIEARPAVAPAGGPAAAGTPAALITAVSDYAAGAGYRSALATCPAGKRATGGGGAVEGVAGPWMTISRPLADLSGWSATGYASANFGAWSVTAYVICA